MKKSRSNWSGSTSLLFCGFYHKIINLCYLCLFCGFLSSTSMVKIDHSQEIQIFQLREDQNLFTMQFLIVLKLSRRMHTPQLETNRISLFPQPSVVSLQNSLLLISVCQCAPHWLTGLHTALQTCSVLQLLPPSELYLPCG